MELGKREQGILQIIVAILFMVGAFFVSTHLEFLGSYGYLGAFIISLVSAATVLLPVPAMAIVFGMSKFLDPILLGVVSGLGSAIGELTGFFAGDGIRDILNDRIKESAQIEQLIHKYEIFAIIILAAIPNPFFDIAGILAGAARMKWWKFLLGCAIGRIIRYILIGFIGEAVL